jgi:hypothetical protein
VTDNLRDRIARNLGSDHGLANDGYSQDDLLSMADGLIRELGLDECDDHDCRCRHEYVTEWTTDE